MKRSLCIAAILLSSSTVYAKSQAEITCPKEIQTSQKLKATPGGFTALETDAAHFWNKVTFYSGKPSDQASLAPDETANGKSVWNFSANDTIYLSCGYNQTSIEIFRTLPKGIHTCSVTLDANSQGNVPEKLHCE